MSKSKHWWKAVHDARGKTIASVRCWRDGFSLRFTDDTGLHVDHEAVSDGEPAFNVFPFKKAKRP